MSLLEMCSFLGCPYREVAWYFNTYFHAQLIRRQFTGFNMKKREVKLAPNKDASSEPVIEVSFKLRQTNGWEVYNESGESEVCSAAYNIMLAMDFSFMQKKLHCLLIKDLHEHA